MRRLWICLLATCAACNGISIGDPGKEVPSACTEQFVERVTDLSALPHGFEHPPAVLFAGLTGTWPGTLDLADGKAVPVTIEITLDEDSVRAVHTNDPRGECGPWLTANVTLVIDAGPTLRGTAEAELSTRHGTRITAEWVAFDDFDSTLAVPDFGGKIVDGPALSLDFLFNPNGSWGAEWQFAARVASTPCDETNQVCTGDPHDLIPDYRELGTVVLQRGGAP